ncbi:hypothetical protein B0H65DRAFT_64567 [Neurospora tetraspora]|uniref:Uncharacterized protein n=1 Tax=Neurospora tetraspora TaxID=94610 RepID=A0AAE0JR32_9PEZI|nr:hypothetical protein B0H65DRAFT_64567 [Neurospora tetraspora]
MGESDEEASNRLVALTSQIFVKDIPTHLSIMLPTLHTHTSTHISLPTILTSLAMQESPPSPTQSPSLITSLHSPLHQIPIHVLQILHIRLQLIHLLALLAQQLQRRLIPFIHLRHLPLQLSDPLSRLLLVLHLAHERHNLRPRLVPLLGDARQLLAHRHLLALELADLGAHALDELDRGSGGDGGYGDHVLHHVVWGRGGVDAVEAGVGAVELTGRVLDSRCGTCV